MLESEFQNISSGGAISYIEIPNMRNNLKALEEEVKLVKKELDREREYTRTLVATMVAAGLAPPAYPV